MEASRELKAPAGLSPEKESSVSIGEDDMWVPDPERILWLRLSVPMLGIEHPFPDIPARNLVISLTEIRRLSYPYELS
jgi:hypothetical protein